MATLNQDVQDVAILINRAPEVVEPSVELEEHFIKVPPVAGSRRSASQAVGISLAKLETPFSDGLVRERLDRSICFWDW
jgi:hypothetical protein